MAARLELVVNRDLGDESIDHLRDRLNEVLNEWGDKHDAKRQMHVREEDLKTGLDDLGLIEEGPAIPIYMIGVGVPYGLVDDIDEQVGGLYESRGNLICSAVRRLLEAERRREMISETDSMSVKTGGLDIADMDGSGRKPWVKLTMQVAKFMGRKDQGRCKEIYERALTELKGVFDTTKNNIPAESG